VIQIGDASIALRFGEILEGLYFSRVEGWNFASTIAAGQDAVSLQHQNDFRALSISNKIAP
jgi:hypothetical protein